MCHVFKPYIFVTRNNRQRLIIMNDINFSRLMLFRVLATLAMALCCTGRCLYGNDKDCILRCRCAIFIECANVRDMTCPSGCAKGDYPLAYSWEGLACQKGNVAYKKAAISNHIPNDASLAARVVDGRISPATDACAHIITAPEIQAMWIVDLGEFYSVNDIIINFGQLSASLGKINNYFIVGVSNSSGDLTNNNTVLCDKYNVEAAPPTVYTATCPLLTVGRYVYYQRLPGATFMIQAYLCEVAVIGHKHIDCSKCPSEVSCNSITGCEQCMGAHQPDCTTVCALGKYGGNCEETCGNCVLGTSCDAASGKCISGCQQWWAPDLCKIKIEEPDSSSITPTFSASTNVSITIEWEQISVPAITTSFYGYAIKHKERDGGTYNSPGLFVKQKAGSTHNVATVGDLKGDTWYNFIVTSYREWSGIKLYGASSQTANIKTKCNYPQVPMLVSATRIPIDDKQEKVDVIFEDLQKLNPGCKEITIAWVKYRDEDNKIQASSLNVSKRTFSFTPARAGKYDIWIEVENNEDLSSISNVESVIVNGPHQDGNMLPLEILIPCVLGGLFIIIVIIIAVCCKRKGKRKQVREEAFDDQSFVESDDEVQEIEVVTMNGQVLPVRPPKSSRKVARPSGARRPQVYENYELQAITPVHVDDFEHYVIRRENTDNFTGEYKSLPSANQSRCVVAKFPDNIKYSRFRNIYPYDDTRVILRTDDPLKGDFINATYMTGYNGAKEYIATQGPNDITVLDFWWMIWQEKSNRIVMVANIHEMGKIRCAQYWPVVVGKAKTFGPFTVTTLSQDICADYTTRTLQLQKRDQVLKVQQFHFTTWEDKNKPMYGATTLLAFFRKVHAFDRYGNGPIVVHCSAGVGRTGTFIALDILQYQAAKERMVDVPTCIRELREERMLMVQTKAQYIFLHHSLIEFIRCGDTSYDCVGFDTTFTRLCAADTHYGGVSRLERQFQLLHDMKKQSTEMRPKDGQLDGNKYKNRDLDIVPDDFDRPHLSGNEKSDYINAVFVDSYRSHDYYLVTQMPLPDTASDFWRMVSSVGSRTIVMLNQFDNTDPTCKPYWPAKVKQTQNYGPIEVTLTSMNEGNKIDSIFVRDFMVRPTKSKKTEGVHVRHFQYLTWPNTEELPPKREDLLILLNMVHKWQRQQTSLPGNTVVHCLTGGVQSGVFCGVSHTLDRMKVEQEIDAFLAVRYVTRRRPQFLETLNQYRFLYEMALECMTRYTDYFK